LAQKLHEKKAAEIGKAEEYRKSQTLATTIAYPLWGVVMIGIAVFNWSSMPPENRVLAYTFIAIGVALVLYGIYKMRRNRLG